MSFEIDAEARARLGRVLNEKWTLEELIGVGGMAAVYRARHRNDARAAVKILHPALAIHPQVRERFLREGYAANHVQHRGAVQVLDDDIVKGGDDDGAAYLVMELLEGESLEQRAARAPPIGEQEFLTIANGVLSVLEAAHANGVVHRDLKPENIFLARDPEEGHLRVKVLDFGLACLTDAQRTTGLGLALGTPAYMSPEQASGRSEEIDGRTDLFALGATGFRLLTRRRIHEEQDVIRLVGRMANQPAPPIRSIQASVSEPVALIIDRALAFRREDRYPNAAAMRADVQAACDVDLPSSTRLIAAPPISNKDLETTDDAALPKAERDPFRAEAAAPGPRRRRSILPFLTLALFGAIAVAYWKWPDSGDTTVATRVADASLEEIDSALEAPPPEVDADLPAISELEEDAADPQDAESLAITPPSTSASAPPPTRPLPPPHPMKRPTHAPTKKPPAPTHRKPR